MTFAHIIPLVSFIVFFVFADFPLCPNGLPPPGDKGDCSNNPPENPCLPGNTCQVLTTGDSGCCPSPLIEVTTLSPSLTVASTTVAPATLTTIASAPLCKDGMGTNTCVDWKNNHGFCSSTVYDDYTKKTYCGLTCNMCTSDSGYTLAPCITVAPHPSATTPVPSTCSDGIGTEKCMNWNKNGFCASAVYDAPTKRTYCAKTCNMCECVDFAAACSVWIRNVDFCNNPEYTLATKKTNCEKSCGFCN